MSGGLGRLILGAHLVLGLTVIVCATTLGALHDLNAQAVVAIFSTAIGLLGGSAAAVGAVGASVNGKAVVAQQTLDKAITSLGESTPSASGARTGA